MIVTAKVHGCRWQMADALLHCCTLHPICNDAPVPRVSGLLGTGRARVPEANSGYCSSTQVLRYKGTDEPHAANIA